MDHYLQNVRTGDRLPLQPDGTLIGTATHANLRTPDGPLLAALVTRYPAGWGLRGLSDDPDVRYNREPLALGRLVTPNKGDLLVVHGERFTVLSPHAVASDVPNSPAPPACRAYVRGPDGREECRVVDHDLLIGRLPVCHVQYADARLSRLGALLASHADAWYIHALAGKPVGRNRRAVESFCRVEDGDELQVGPLWVRLEIGDLAPPPAASAPAARTSAAVPEAGLATDTFDGSETADPDAHPDTPDLTEVRVGGARLDQWLKSRLPSTGSGPMGWLDAQREKLRVFWYDVPEATTARSLRTAGKPAEAFAILDKAIRARPEGPELLRELYRLYDSVGLTQLCYRPLRQIEKLAAARGRPDPWVLEALARVCGELSKDRASMFDRSISYWHKLEAATGVSRVREREAAMAIRALRTGGFSKPAHGAADDR